MNLLTIKQIQRSVKVNGQPLWYSGSMSTIEKVAEQPLPDEVTAGAKELQKLSEHEQPPSRENFLYQAEDIFSSLSEAAKSGVPRQLEHKKLVKSYVDDAESLVMRQHAEVILGAPLAYEAQQQINRLRKQQKQTPSESTKATIDQLRTALCSYNHLIRDLVSQNAGAITRADMEGWLGKATRSEAWGRQIIAGVAGEVAAGRALIRIPGVASVEYSTVEEDLSGVDLKITNTSGQTYPVDLKYGEGQGAKGTHKRGSTLVLALEADMVDEFDVLPNRMQEFEESYYAA